MRFLIAAICDDMNDFLIFLAGISIGGLLSWLISHRYYLKSGADQKVQLTRLRLDLKSRNTVAEFENLLRTSTWTKQLIDHCEIWMSDADNTFQIEQGTNTREFKESWTTIYPDQNSIAYPIYLKINGITIKEIDFISMDGGRIFVPKTEKRLDFDGKIDYFWNLNGLEILVCHVIGCYYIYGSIEGVARTSRVALVE